MSTDQEILRSLIRPLVFFANQPEPTTETPTPEPPKETNDPPKRKKPATIKEKAPPKKKKKSSLTLDNFI